MAGRCYGRAPRRGNTWDALAFSFTYQSAYCSQLTDFQSTETCKGFENSGRRGRTDRPGERSVTRDAGEARYRGNDERRC